MRPWLPSTPRTLISFQHMSNVGGTFAKYVEGFVARGGALLVDCGAFSVNVGTLGGIDMAGYLRFLEWARRITPYYIQLDVGSDRAQSWRNLVEMRERGLEPIPVITVDAEASHAAKLVAGHEAAGICVAGGVKQRDEWYHPRLAAVRRYVGPEVKIHALGYTRSYERMATCAADSFDSSSHMFVGRSAILSLPGGQKVSGGRQLGAKKLKPAQIAALLKSGVSAHDLHSDRIAKGSGRAIEVAMEGVAHLDMRLAAINKTVWPVSGCKYQTEILERVWNGPA